MKGEKLIMYDVGQILDAVYVQSKPYGTSHGNLKIHIGDLMKKIPVGVPSITPVSLDKSCYANSKECAPTISSMINTQNFVTASASLTPYACPHYYFNSPIKVKSMTRDCLSCRLSPEDADNSKYVNI